MPSDTSVSIDEDRCRACRSAAAWNGHAAQVATGEAACGFLRWCIVSMVLPSWARQVVFLSGPGRAGQDQAASSGVGVPVQVLQSAALGANEDQVEHPNCHKLAILPAARPPPQVNPQVSHDAASPARRWDRHGRELARLDARPLRKM
jgi:hypothetical protein